LELRPNNLKEQALTWARAGLATLGQLLDRQPDEAPALEDSIRRLDAGLASLSSH
jgi:hypothetical protein